MNVLLFDLDGVLVQPLGYRKAIEAVFRHCVRGWGWPDMPPPDEEVIAFYEAHSITSEWDMLPLMLAAVWDAWAAAYGTPPEGALDASHPDQPPPPPDYRAAVLRLVPHLRAGAYPAEVALAQQHQDPDHAPFPHLPAASPLLRRLLSHTRDVAQNHTTRLFQQFALGSAAFTATYGLPAEVETPSFLEQYDRPLLEPLARARLQTLLARGEAVAAAYTARPSAPPHGEPTRPGYAPEAEMALTAAGVPSLPLIGFGRLAWLAEQYDLPPEKALLKPAPFHALAAIFAALLGDERAALQRAAAWLLESRPLTEGLSPAITLYGFEDSVAGLHGMAEAAATLREAGIAVTFQPFGIATHPDKKTALRRTGAHIVPSINHALSRL
ncbi:MAG TPA: hypothetical protein ENJ54_05330 [Chloroflexi bacterium]|nr:hypothetical protein [Chloroflexota bacterium]